MEGWSQLHADIFYRKFEVYSRCWNAGSSSPHRDDLERPRHLSHDDHDHDADDDEDRDRESGIDLRALRSFSCSAGGPIVLLAQEPSTKPTIELFTSSGVNLATIEPKFYNSIVGMGWSSSERFVFVLEDGTVLLYSALGEVLRRFQLEGDCSAVGVQDVVIWAEGLVCLTKNLQVYAMLDFDAPFTVKLKAPVPALTLPPLAWVVQPPALSRSGELEVYLALSTGSVLFVTKDEVQDLGVTRGPFLRMALSPDGKMLACFTAKGDVWVTRSDFSRELSTFETKSQRPPKQLAWCGPDAVLCYWETPEESVVFMIGPNSKWLRYAYDSAVALVPELDGVRILSRRGTEYLQRVPPVTVSIYKLGSTAPVALLVSAHDMFEKRDPKSDELIRTLKAQDQLGAAVEACIEAASHEFDPALQRKFLSAASFGKSFVSGRQLSPDAFVKMSRDLRVLNAVREASIGMAMTHAQLQRLGMDTLIDRLIGRHQHLLAFEISSYLGLSPAKVVVHWASHKVRSELPDPQIVVQIVEKLKAVPGATFALIAAEAHAAKRSDLAARLLDFEPRAARQVPLLIQMDKLDRALAKALNSGDSDLIDLVLLSLRRKPLLEFYKALEEWPEAERLWVYTCMQMREHRALEALFRHTSRHERLAALTAREAQQQGDDVAAKERLLKLAAEHFRPVDPVAQKLTQDEIGLLLLQRDLEANSSHKFVGLSLTDTLSKVIALKQMARAEKMKNDFAVPAKRFAWIVVKSLAKAQQWEELRAFSKTPSATAVTLGVFVQLCAQNGNVTEATQYLGRMRENSERAIGFARCNMWTEAIEAARQVRDNLELLEKLQLMCNDSQALATIQQLLHDASQ